MTSGEIGVLGFQGGEARGQFVAFRDKWDVVLFTVIGELGLQAGAFGLCCLRFGLNGGKSCLLGVIVREERAEALDLALGIGQKLCRLADILALRGVEQYSVKLGDERRKVGLEHDVLTWESAVSQ